MNNELQQIWVYLSASPLTALTLTLVAYQIGDWIYRRAGRFPLFNPVLLAVLMLVAFLLATDTDYATYFEGAQFVHFMLGPATVALAVPLYLHFAQIRKSALAVGVSLVLGSVTAASSAVVIAWAMEASRQTVISLAPKSVTTPIAMGIAEKLGGLPSLTAVLVILTGMTGALFGGFVLNVLRIKDREARGLAMGTASHGIGTARALEVHPVSGAFAGLAMGLNGLATAILLPLLFDLLF
ncbi:LrgB family protein [Magnetospira sp. QH-2]|uniref:LrgB family protein n=1 Tax=Magnetospira sp. (strain QH-2) TaxID=1288970 RepID=UPI0003E817F6|nr:LrgB family protein [Magnetospira sp. QH-2]CCQ72251.1 Effector of murein hydrolase (LrgB-like, involved in penicillin tolerance) [Magnetospira sp. QH-2]